MHIEGLTPHSIAQAAGESPTRAREEARLKDACQQFESLFLAQMLSQMSKTAGKGLFGSGQEAKMLQGMLDQERARVWAEQGGIGLANLLYQQMKDTL